LPRLSLADCVYNNTITWNICHRNYGIIYYGREKCWRQSHYMYDTDGRQSVLSVC
jgi:hypothetical protein